MISECLYCSDREFLTQSALYTGKSCILLVPKNSHIAPEDGGHLMVIPKRHVESRLLLNPIEMLELDFLSMVGSKTLTKLLGTHWFNYQENGNWLLNNGALQHMHLHIYGRSITAKEQLYGEALRFPLKKDLKDWKVKPLSVDQISNARKIVKMLLTEYWTEQYDKILRTKDV